MKKLLFTVFISLFAFQLLAQDTVVVQTLNFGDITKRRGWYIFPEDTNRYEKILMYYTLKCDNATTQDQYPCGEWDYTTYTRLYQHQNVGAPRYLVNGGYPDTIEYVTNPTYTYYQQQQYFIVYDNTVSQTDYSIGSGANSVTHTFNATIANNKAQYLWQASELTSAGLTAGNIDKIKLDFTTLGSDLNYLTIKMKHTAFNSIDEIQYETVGFTEVYHLNTQIGSTGINTLNLTTPFNWDGLSNIVVEFSFSNAATGTGHTLAGETTAFNSAVYSTQDDGKLDFVWGDYVEVPATAFGAIDSFITVSFWCYGASNLPQNTYIFEGTDANGRRVINSHLPWSNSNVYWDAGNSGTTTYDRINQVANAVDFKGQWNHWAFTKDVSTGEMKIFLNGSLWLSGTGMTRTMDGITSFKIGGQASSYGKYDGAIHDFRVWNVALDSTTIQDWMYKDVDGTHPYFTNLQFYYKFDDMTGNIASDDAGFGANPGNLMGMPSWNYIKGWDQYRNMTAAMERPNIVFTQGTYTSHIDSVMVLDSVMNSPVSIVEYTTSIDTNNAGITMSVVDTTFGWEAGWVYTYDQYGNVTDSTFIGYDNQLVNNYKEDIFQLQNYVTPYGIGLNLGPNGFRWIYDVTDYAPLFHDTVEISAGNQQELIDLKFIMIKGIPPRDVVKLESLQRGDYQHSDIANDIQCKANIVTLDPTAASFRIKTRTTGHWFGGFQNCAEFCPKDHNVFVDGTKRFEWTNWTECADNPVIAQGGTWIYDRAGWCPGSFADTYDWELTPFVTPGNTHSLDYGMQITAGGMEGNYRMTMQLVSYSANNFNLDARVDDIIAPTNWEYRSKINPICTDPIVVIQNTGSTTLTTLTITYNVNGGTPEVYNWSGNLAFLEKESVTLPIPGMSFWNGSGQNVFEVTVSAPNGGSDEYPSNNSASSSFEIPDLYTDKFYLKFQTNNAGYENSYTVKDYQGNIVMQRTGMANNTTYNDTIDLPDGCYVFEVLDTDDDGMSFFANNDGNGQVRFLWIPPATPFSKTFNTQFGKFMRYSFIVDRNVGIEGYNKMYNVDVYPNPTKDVFTINLSGFDEATVNLTICNTLGENIYGEVVNPVNGIVQKSIDLSAIPNGIYYVRVFAGNNYAVKKIIKN